MLQRVQRVERYASSTSAIPIFGTCSETPLVSTYQQNAPTTRPHVTTPTPLLTSPTPFPRRTCAPVSAHARRTLVPPRLHRFPAAVAPLPISREPCVEGSTCIPYPPDVLARKRKGTATGNIMEWETAKTRRVKKKHVQSEDGWTVVAGSGSRTDSSHHDASIKKAKDVRPTRIVPGLTVEKLVAELKDMEKRWRRSSCARTLENMMRLRDWRVDKAACIGIGSFSLDWEHRYRSLWQLVLFMDVVKLLQQDSLSLTLHAQEPAFTPLDVEFLATLSITSIEANIETGITQTSFVFAPFVDWYILLPVFLKHKDPKLYIGNEVLSNYAVYANTEEKRKMLDESNGVGAAFAKGRERRRVPGFEEHAQALEGLMVYWREEEEDDAE
jgi:hypothetical protein